MFFWQHASTVLLLPGAASAFTTVAVSGRSLSLCRNVEADTVPPLLAASSSSSTEETEAERLLRKARELRASATQEEAQIHGTLTQKKTNRDQQSDALIDELFPKGATPDETELVNALRSKKLGMTTLERIMLRIDERQAMAQGWDHVECNHDDGQFRRVFRDNKKDPAELERLEGLTSRLIQAVAVLDEEFREEKKRRGQSYVSHAEEEHFGGGKCAEHLQARFNEVQRERSEQFQKRMEELREAQRRKDDHKFDGYNDLGSLN